MNETHIHNAIGELSEDLLTSVETLRMKKRHPALQWVAAAACLCLLLGLPLGSGDWFAAKAENGRYDMFVGSPQENILTDTVDDSASYVSVLRARVLEVHDGYILVEPQKGNNESNSSDRCEVSLSKIKEVPHIKVGDIVEIAYDGMVQEVYPPRITGILSIKVIE